MEGWQLASGRCLNDCWEGLQSAFFWGKPKELTTHDDMIKLKDSHLSTVLFYDEPHFHFQQETSIISGWKKKRKNQLSGPHLSKILRSLPLVAVPFIAGNAPQLLGRATEVLRECTNSTTASAEKCMAKSWLTYQSLKTKRVFLPTVDGSDIRRSPVDMVNIFTDNRWLAGLFPSTITSCKKHWRCLNFANCATAFCLWVPYASLLVSPSPWKTHFFWSPCNS